MILMVNKLDKKRSFKRKKILIISQYFPPDISGGGTRAFNYAKCLSEKNFDVTVITAFPHLHSNVPPSYKKKFLKKETIDGFNTIRVWIPSILHNSIKNRLILHFSFIFSSLFPMFSLKPDVIFASEPNLFSIIPAFFYAKLRGGKVIRVVDDLWPEVIYERGYVKSKIIRMFLDSLAKFSYNFPIYVLPLTNEAKNHIIKNYHLPKEKIVVIEHGVDIKYFNPQEKDNEESFVLMYSGSLVESYDFDLLLEAANSLKHHNIKFIIRGKGKLLSYIKEKKEQLNLFNLDIDSDLVNNDKLSSILSKADAFIVPLKDDYFLNLSLPTKILEFQALRKPVICCSSGAPGKYLKETNSGIMTTPGILSELIDAILVLKSQPEMCKNLGNNGRAYVEKNLTFDKISDRLKNLIESIYQNSNNSLLEK